MKTYILIAVAVLLVGGVGFGIYYIMSQGSQDTEQEIEEEIIDRTQNEEPDEMVEEPEEEDKPETILGSSVEGRDITAYHYGSGDTELLFMGGIHGGYEWNTVLVAYEFMDYLEKNPSVIPDNIKVTVVPVLNPDGLYKVVGTIGRFTKADVPAQIEETVPGRFNANNVDLNRNFDCDWQPVGTWRSTPVKGGSKAFSEPESQAFRDYVETAKPNAVVVWYSAAGGVFASNCHGGVLPETLELTKLYADASGYKAYKDFDFYEINGDVVNWLAKNKIPGISILLATHNDVEWPENKAGIEAIFDYYAE